MDLSRLSDGLTHDTDSDIWRSQQTSAVAYPEGDHATCFALEDESFWFRHRNACIIAAVKRHAPAGLVLDVGGGNGFVSRGLLNAGVPVVLLEPGPLGALNARRARQIPDVICATLDDAAFLTGSIPSAGLFDVLEHIEDDHAAVAQLHRVVQPGGYLFVTVPAYEWLWSTSDVAALHFRRYSPRTLQRVLEPAFEIVYLTALFARLVPAFFVLRTVPYALRLRRSISEQQFASEHRAGGSASAGVLTRLLTYEEGMVARGASQRWGSTLLAVARRR